MGRKVEPYHLPRIDRRGERKQVNTVCPNCEKKLHADQCGFSNETFKELMLYYCPYCEELILRLMPICIEEMPSLRESFPMSEKVLKRRLDQRLKKIRHKMIEMNDEAIKALSAILAWADEHDPDHT